MSGLQRQHSGVWVYLVVCMRYGMLGDEAIFVLRSLSCRSVRATKPEYLYAFCRLTVLVSASTGAGKALQPSPCESCVARFCAQNKRDIRLKLPCFRGERRNQTKTKPRSLDRCARMPIRHNSCGLAPLSTCARRQPGTPEEWREYFP